MLLPREIINIIYSFDDNQYIKKLHKLCVKEICYEFKNKFKDIVIYEDYFMNLKNLAYCLIVVLIVPQIYSQQVDNKKNENINTNKFRQLYQEFSSPNIYRAASGAPGPAYYQQQADYKINVELDDKNKMIYGDETITYTNNSPQKLDYLWVQLDQNVRKKDSPSLDRDSESVVPYYIPDSFDKEFLKDSFDGGFNIEHVNDMNNKPLEHIINQTMMRVNLPKPLSTGEQFSFKIKWW